MSLKLFIKMLYKVLQFSTYLLLFHQAILGQDLSPLIQTAWANNAALKAKEFNLKAAEAAWNEARSMFGPQVGLNLQYTLAAGGRTIDLPIGDLLNPVYTTLNQLTQTQNFSPITNTAVQFLPNNFYDLRLRATQPIYYPDLYIQRSVKAEMVVSAKLEQKAFKRLIAKETMDAYFQYQLADYVIGIYAAADSLMSEASRVTHSLMKNGLATPLALSRIDNQRAIIQGNTIASQSQKENALSALQFTIGTTQIPSIILAELPDTSQITAAENEDITRLEHSQNLYNLGIKREENFYKPRIGAFADAGSQAFNFAWAPYVLVGINLEFNLYDNKRHQRIKQRYQNELQSSHSSLDHAKRQVRLLTDVSYRNLTSSVRQATILRNRITHADRNYQDALRRYKEGTGQYLEIIDAQSQKTQIEIQYLLSRLTAWQKWGEYIYATAAYPIND